MEQTKFTRDELIAAGSHNIPDFGRIFFPRTVRQLSPEFHYDVSRRLMSKDSHFVGLKIFRGGAKTSLFRLAAAQRIAYALSRTGQIVGVNQEKAKAYLRWLKKAVEYNKLYSSVFSLTPGSKWSDEWIEINNGLMGVTISLVATGITGSLRGLNLDDYRPDFTLCDDICDEENTATVEARQKISDAFFGALANSLAPKSEAPLAQLALAQTPINPLDIISLAEKDSAFSVAAYSCFDESGQSRWPARWTTEELLKKKASFVQRNELSLWMREMEVTLISREAAKFKLEWIRYWTVLPDGMDVIIAIDPASSDNPKADWQVATALGFLDRRCFVLETHRAKGESPDELVDALFRMVLRWRPRVVVVEAVGYQRILAWYVDKKKRDARIYFNVEEVQDKRRKEDRITQAVLEYAPYGDLYFNEAQIDLIAQFQIYGTDASEHDDDLDALAMGITYYKTRGLLEGSIEAEFKRLDEGLAGEAPVGNFMGCP